MTERLSDKNPCKTCQKSCSLGYECEERANYEYDCIKKLAEYETAEEEGRSMILPCKVGDTVYLILNTDDFVNPIISCKARQIIIRDYGTLLSLVSTDEMIGHMDCYPIEDIGEKIFFTREEAEKALKEMG